MIRHALLTVVASPLLPLDAIQIADVPITFNGPKPHR